MTEQISQSDLLADPIVDWNGPLGLPRFDAIAQDAFAAAFDTALAAHEAEIAAIAGGRDDPTVDNTLAPLELSGLALSRVAAIFWCKAGADTNDTIQALEREIAPKMARHASALYMNDALFRRIDALYEQRETLDLDAETKRVLERTWKRFVRAGAKLDAAGKVRLAAINEELASLGAGFGQNVLADEREWALFLGEDQLAGLPGFLRGAMAEAAASRGQEGRYAVTLSRSIVEPFLAFSAHRELRVKAYRAFIGRGQNGGAHDNSEIVAKTLALRAEKAGLLGYPSFAAFKLDDTMAKTPQRVFGLLEPVWEKALEKADAERAELQRIASDDGQNDPIAGWDWRYYAEKLRAERFDFDAQQVKSYLQLDNVIAACFDVAGRLFGLSFEERKDIAAWHEDVRVFEVRDPDGSHRATFLADHFNRSSKRSGAWMSALQPGHRLGAGAKPIVYNVMNFAKPARGEKALLSLDEARTLFHEFGHALHGMLSDVTWPSVSGTSVSRDFVELPSQLYEHWLMVPEILEKHALHEETGEAMPRQLIGRIEAARTFGAGFAAVEFTASALVDMAFHAQGEAPEDPLRFEAETLARLNMPEAIAMRHRTPHFLHVFSGDGYSAGYYSYMWSEVLDADAFAAFEEAGDVFDPGLAQKLREHIYAAGGSADPEDLYTAFRGALPDPQAMMEKRGLT
ncbi:M3 family metallopeptidase [Mesorhizobium xinjiangense]|uniref:M3 family metallopeptidase n=1 Tax=Mesorhizobium xinjiangense TaxID=2678685 RepID=UPI0012ECC2EF|nr:M3 family metallopeptidase [Mesorhizobium xinjiangense]